MVPRRSGYTYGSIPSFTSADGGIEFGSDCSGVGGVAASNGDHTQLSNHARLASGPTRCYHSPRGWVRLRVGMVIAIAVTALSVGFCLAFFSTKSSSEQEEKLLSRSGSSVVAAAYAPAVTLEEIPVGNQQQQQQQQATVDSTFAYRTESAHGGAGGDKTRLEEASSSVLGFVALNEYTRRGDVVGAGYPWLEGKIMVEPYRKTSLEVNSPVEGMAYQWEVYENGEDGRGSQLGKYYGQAVEVVFGKAPQYAIVLLEYPDSLGGTGGAGKAASASRQLEQEVLCKWVRREIRSLLDDDRNDILDAMKVLWDVKTEDGKKIYGEQYMDVWDIDKFHQIAAADIDCDHFHDGIGFGISHSMLTMMFEASMQLVNPKVSLPYWDYTIESAIIDSQYDGDYSKIREVSDLWTEDWFGDVTENGQVNNGRWAYMEVPVLPQEERESLYADVFGRMRSPWNVNDEPYLVRGMGDMCGIPTTSYYAWPTCSTHYDLNDLYSSYYSYTWQSAYQPHGPVHVWLGGPFNCKENMDAIVSITGEEYRASVTGYSFTLRKALYRDHLWKCHGFADAGTSAKELMLSGQCGCTGVDFEEGDDYRTVNGLFTKSKNVLPDLVESDQRKLAAQFCNGELSINESSQSSSPLDPAFWPLHPTMERLLSFKLLNGFADYSWPDTSGTWTGMDGVSYDIVISAESDECYGHRGSDVFPYGIRADTVTPTFTFYGKTGPNTRSNRELVHLFDPHVNALPYIYDNFNWDHCEAVGVDFKDFFDTSAGKPGPATSGATQETSTTSGKPIVKGFGIFRAGEEHGPLYNPPAIARQGPQR